jgi:8-oxo-dGTP diphosphatase
MVLNVVAAIIRNDEGKILIALRKDINSKKGKWEFPGGKIEPGETSENALIREIKEELDIDIKVLKHFISIEHQYPDFFIRLHSYLAELVNDQKIILNEHQTIEWVEPYELNNFEFSNADIKIIEKILK